jgi:hypothetical protein
MLDIKDRDAKLHSLYAAKNFWIFMFGEEVFYKKVKKVHWDWEQSGTLFKVTDDDVIISMIAFEIDNNY